MAYVRAYNFRPSPNFSAKALRAFAQLLPPCPPVPADATLWRRGQVLLRNTVAVSKINHQSAKGEKEMASNFGRFTCIAYKLTWSHLHPVLIIIIAVKYSDQGNNKCKIINWMFTFDVNSGT